MFSFLSFILQGIKKIKNVTYIGTTSIKISAEKSFHVPDRVQIPNADSEWHHENQDKYFLYYKPVRSMHW